MRDCFVQIDFQKHFLNKNDHLFLDELLNVIPADATFIYVFKRSTETVCNTTIQQIYFAIIHKRYVLKKYKNNKYISEYFI